MIDHIEKTVTESVVDEGDIFEVTKQPSKTKNGKSSSKILLDVNTPVQMKHEEF